MRSCKERLTRQFQMRCIEGPSHQGTVAFEQNILGALRAASEKNGCCRGHDESSVLVSRGVNGTGVYRGLTGKRTPCHEKEVVAVWQKLWHSMQVLVEGSIMCRYLRRVSSRR